MCIYILTGAFMPQKGNILIIALPCDWQGFKFFSQCLLCTVFHCTYIHLFYTVFHCTLVHTCFVSLQITVYSVSLYTHPWLFCQCLLYTVFHCTFIHGYFVSVYCIQCFIVHSSMAILSVFTVYSVSLYIHPSSLSVITIY